MHKLQYSSKTINILKQILSYKGENSFQTNELFNKSNEAKNKTIGYNKSKNYDNKTKEDDKKSQKNKNNKIKGRANNKDNSNSIKNGPFYIPKTFGDQKLEISFNDEDAIKTQLNKKVDNSVINSFPKDKLKYALFTIGKLEYLLARDFIIYYLQLGVDKIFIYDNNEIDNRQRKI